MKTGDDAAMRATAGATPRARVAIPVGPDWIDLARQWTTLALLATALIAGGGGIAAPLSAMAVELVGAFALSAVAVASIGRAADRRATPMAILAVLIVATPALQLVPLPPALWHALPGRSTAYAVRTMLGLDARWFPFSLSPELTRQSATALIPGIAMFFSILLAGYRERYRLLLLLIALAVADLLLGAIQIATHGDPMFLLHEVTDTGIAVGFFVNRNHNADLLLIAPLLIAAALSWDPWERFGGWARGGSLAAFVFFGIGVLGTLSRMGAALTVVALAGVLVVARPPGAPGRLRGVLALVPVLAGGALAATLLLAYNGQASQLLVRFAAHRDQRYDFWPDVIYAIRQLAPFGSGLGTFDIYFRSVEQLDTMLDVYVNHAHDDYLEIALETGVWGAALVAAGLLMLGRMLWAHARAHRRADRDPLAVAALFGLLVMLLHSLVDYPLRTLALETVFGLLCGLLFVPARRARAVPEAA